MSRREHRNNCIMISDEFKGDRTWSFNLCKRSIRWTNPIYGRLTCTL